MYTRRSRKPQSRVAEPVIANGRMQASTTIKLANESD
jgi:hypothetical protein